MHQVKVGALSDDYPHPNQKIFQAVAAFLSHSELAASVNILKTVIILTEAAFSLHKKVKALIGEVD